MPNPIGTDKTWEVAAVELMEKSACKVKPAFLLKVLTLEIALADQLEPLPVTDMALFCVTLPEVPPRATESYSVHTEVSIVVPEKLDENRVSAKAPEDILKIPKKMENKIKIFFNII